MIGQCANCAQRSELHADPDGRSVCEDCVTGRTPLGARMKSQTLLVRQDSAPSRRDDLLDFIVTHITPDVLTRLISLEVARITALLEQQEGWVDLIERETNERKLLFLAHALGYALPAPSQRKTPARLKTPDRLKTPAATHAKRPVSAPV